MTRINPGDTVKAHYRSGTYIGEMIENRGDRYLIKVLAVLKHPLQGDLHNLKGTDDVFFHERKALALHEKMNVKKPAVHPFDEAVPDYEQSLISAVENYRKKLQQETSPYNEKALKVLNHLEENVYKKHVY